MNQHNVKRLLFHDCKKYGKRSAKPMNPEHDLTDQHINKNNGNAVVKPSLPTKTMTFNKSQIVNTKTEQWRPQWVLPLQGLRPVFSSSHRHCLNDQTREFATQQQDLKSKHTSTKPGKTRTNKTEPGTREHEGGLSFCYTALFHIGLKSTLQLSSHYNHSRKHKSNRSPQATLPTTNLWVQLLPFLVPRGIPISKSRCAFYFSCKNEHAGQHKSNTHGALETSWLLLVHMMS